MKNKKLLWITGGLLLAIVVCGLLVWFGSGMVEMIRNHLGL